MLKAWRAHQAEVRRRAEAGEPPLKTIEECRAERADALPDDDAPEPEPDPEGADSAESEVPTRVRTFDSCVHGVEAQELERHEISTRKCTEHFQPSSIGSGDHGAPNAHVAIAS